MSLDGYCAAIAGGRQQRWMKKKARGWKEKARAVRDGMPTRLGLGREKKKVINNSKQVITEGQRDSEKTRTRKPSCLWVISSPSHLDQATSFTSFLSPNSAGLVLGP